MKEEEKNEYYGNTEEGRVEEEDEDSSQEDDRVENKEPERVLPSLLKVDLDEFGLEDGEIMSGGELLSESESGGVITGRKFKPAAVNFDLPLLFLASFSEL